jgi:hypothetical protein
VLGRYIVILHTYVFVRSRFYDFYELEFGGVKV